jgi:long-chain acyl-CoA synthetase
MGYRISPEEIEECLCKMTGISEAAALGISDQEHGNRIKAFVVCADGFTVTGQEVINYCRAHLPYYMVPNIVEFRAAIPKTATFKINRSQLS